MAPQHLCSLKGFVLLASSVLLLLSGPVCPSDLDSSVPPEPSLTLETPQAGAPVILLCRAPEGHSGVLFELYRERKMVDSMRFQQETENARFTVREEGGGDSRELYCCMYHDRHRRRSVFSSPYLELEWGPGARDWADLLPAPLLSELALDPGDEEVILECKGLQSYPGAEFTLFHLGSTDPLTVRHAPATRSVVRFHLSVRQPHPTPYQCQYSVLLGPDRKQSERSHALTLTGLTGTNLMTDVAPRPPPPSGAPDWPLITGCVSAALLFLVVLAGLAIALHRRVKALAEKRKKREEVRFWQHLHSTDHILDLTLRRGSIGSLEWGDSPSARLRTSSQSTQCPLSTFQNPAVS
ncbi:hypothetical protein AAFF_G00379950 [Aldrovandia affinis]|uniref:C19orf38 Ig domain-containing protein n=1 Tax=Aldrovandia affinis TaxID=143900 RepID=A0AAD7T843_9TELE|nr:hypothetical protein AAFF_G00379950 [Aldrovandia affinis]